VAVVMIPLHALALVMQLHVLIIAALLVCYFPTIMLYLFYYLNWQLLFRIVNEESHTREVISIMGVNDGNDLVHISANPTQVVDLYNSIGGQEAFSIIIIGGGARDMLSSESGYDGSLSIVIGDYASIINGHTNAHNITNQLLQVESTFVGAGDRDHLASVSPSMVAQLLLVAQIMIKSQLIHHMVISLYVVIIVQVHSIQVFG
jgi:hypothetical protein